MSEQPAWMDEENTRATKLATSGETNNNNAPKMIKVTRAPKRKQKLFYIQEKHEQAFNQLVLNEKQVKGKKGSELAEEALELLFKKYGLDFN